MVVVSIAVAVVIRIQTVVLQATGTLPASWQSPAPVHLDLTWTQTSHPPAEGSTLWNTHIHTQLHTIKEAILYIFRNTYDCWGA